jgi:hypothetical protein
MWRVAGFALAIAIAMGGVGCGGVSGSPGGGFGSLGGGSGDTEVSTSAISISPSSAAAGSPDVVLTITGSNFLGARHNFSQAVWSSNGSQTELATTFVSSTQLTAVVPANLLISPVSAQVFVRTGDPMGDLPLRRSDPAGFTVTALPVGAASISSISPETVTAGSSDLTVTITGSNFDFERLHMSIAFWSASPRGTHCCDKGLETTFLSSTQLTAVIPAALLQSPVTAYVYVETGDPIGMSDGVSYPKTNSVTFTVGQ